MYSLQDDSPPGTVLQEVGHLLLQRRLHLMLGDQLEVLPRCLAAALHLRHVLLQQVEVHLETQLRYSSWSFILN